MDAIAAPWAPDHQLIRASLVARPGRRIAGPKNIVLIVDVSSMLWDRVPRVRDAVSNVIEALDARDRVSLVTFNGPRGAVATAVSGADHARLRFALDSLELGPSDGEPDVLAMAARVARRGVGERRETRVILVSDVDEGMSDLANSDPVASARSLAAEGFHVDVIHLAYGRDMPRLSAFARAGRGRLLDASTEENLQAAIARVFGVTLPMRLSDARFQFQFDRRRVAQWRCLNDVGGRTQRTHTQAESERLYAGMSASVLCEIVPVSAKSMMMESVGVTAQVDFRDASGRRQSFDATAAPDSLLRHDTHVVADAAAFGMLLRERNGAGAWTLDSVAVDLDRRANEQDDGGVAASLAQIVRRAASLRNAPPRPRKP